MLIEGHDRPFAELAPGIAHRNSLVLHSPREGKAKAPDSAHLPFSTPLLQSAYHAHQHAATGVAMPTIEELKAKVQAEIDRRGDDIVRVAQTILQHPEPGFREHKTAKLVAQKFQEFGVSYEDGIAITG